LVLPRGAPFVGHRAPGSQLQPPAKQLVDVADGARDLLALAFGGAAVALALAELAVLVAREHLAGDAHHLQALVARVVDGAVKVAGDSAAGGDERAVL